MIKKWRRGGWKRYVRYALSITPGIIDLARKRNRLLSKKVNESYGKFKNIPQKLHHRIVFYIFFENDEKTIFDQKAIRCLLGDLFLWSIIELTVNQIKVRSLCVM